VAAIISEDMKLFDVIGPTSLRELLVAVNEVSVNDLERRLLWRGQDNSAWGLAPGLYRRILNSRTGGALPSEDELRAYETDLMFRAIALGWYGDTHFSSYAVLQHHGAATRLLDVTRDPMVALWFAVRSDGPKDGVLYSLDANDAEQHTFVDTPSWIGVIEHLTPGRLGLYEPPWADERVKAQRALFMFSRLTGGESARNAYVSMSGGKLGTMIIVPNAMKRSAREYLQQHLGLTEEAMFPDLDGFARANGAAAALPDFTELRHFG
jgi:hypothetical protein